jgi:hypothetical protein
LKNLVAISGYIVGFNDKDKPNVDCSPASIASATWTMTVSNEPARTTLKGLVKEGFDAQIKKVQDSGILEFINTFPNSLSTDGEKRKEQVALLLEVLQITKICPSEVQATFKSLNDLNGPMKVLKDHMTIQMSPTGAKWFKQYLNEIALKANLPQPHPDVIPGTGQKGQQFL